MMIKRGVSGSVQHFSDSKEQEIESVKADINKKEVENEEAAVEEETKIASDTFECPGLTVDEDEE